MPWFRKQPELSVVVVVYDMGREAPRTLESLAVPYQQQMATSTYEVIVVDNGSPEPLPETLVRDMGPNFFYHYIEDASPSPASAINRGAALARGKILGIMIDPWTERGELECPAHLDYARAKSAPLLLSSCFLVFGCTRYEPAFFEAGCQG